MKVRRVRSAVAGEENPSRQLGRCKLRGLTVVELEHAAEPPTASDGASADHRDLRRDELIVQTLVRPFFMIVIDERKHRGPEVPFAAWHEPRQTLGSDRPPKSFRERVRAALRPNHQGILFGPDDSRR
jgi:hypothetical protein